MELADHRFRKAPGGVTGAVALQKLRHRILDADAGDGRSLCPRLPDVDSPVLAVDPFPGADFPAGQGGFPGSVIAADQNDLYIRMCGRQRLPGSGLLF